MNKDTYWHLIMQLSYGYGGEIGPINDTSPLGYAELAEEYEELTMESFINKTEGRISTGITIIEVLEDGGFVCLLDDENTIGVIDKETQEFLTNLEEELYQEYIERLEQQLGTSFETDDTPDFEIGVFSNMVKEKGFYCEPFNDVGFFEHPSTIERSKADLEYALKEATEGEDLGEDNFDEETN